MALRGTRNAIIGAAVIGLATAVGLVLSGDKNVTAPAQFGGLVSVITWGGALSKPPESEIVCAQFRADCSPRCMAFIKQDAGTGQWGEDIIVRSCGREWDGGSPLPLDVAKEIAEELVYDPNTMKEVAYDGGPAVVFFRGTARDNEHLCACAPPGGTGCERLNNADVWVATANWNNIIDSGKWRGAGCIRMQCEKRFGGPSVKPAGCQ
jgi:hypothetical protein